MARRLDARQLAFGNPSSATRAQLIALLIRVERVNTELLQLYEHLYDDTSDEEASRSGPAWDWLFARRFALVERARELRRLLTRPSRDGSVQLRLNVRVDSETLLQESAEVDIGEAWVLGSAVAPLVQRRGPGQPLCDGGPSPPGCEASGSRLR